jgi:protein-S-isoprenylcysteine O-methyltransferase Ste14
MSSTISSTPSTPSTPASDKPRLPKSPTNFGLNLICLGILLAVVFGLRAKIIHVPNPVIFLAAATTIPVVFFDVVFLKVHRRESTGLDWDKPFNVNPRRVALKLLGFFFTLLPFGIAYWTFPEYQGSFYDPYYGLFKQFWPGLLASTIFYVILVDTLQKEPEDPYWQIGAYAWSGFMDSGLLHKRKVANHYVGWLVKAYFFPLMFVWLTQNTHRIINFDLSQASWSNLRMYDFLYDFIFFFDLLFATAGYAVCFKAIDTHIRSAEPTMLGWCVALFCYEPFFNGLFEQHYAKYGGGGFQSWLEPYPVIRWIVAGAVLFLVLVYVMATIAFGVRFSNLTHRGILTNGPYRFTKHPAYVAKNSSWWLTATPFLAHDSISQAIKRCLMLLLMNFMYFMRAKTEERHLSQDPTYVEYGRWMNEHGLLRFLNKIPIFRYNPPKNPEPFLAAIPLPLSAPAEPAAGPSA